MKLTGLLPIEQAAAIRTLLDAYVSPRAGASVAFRPSDEPGGSEPTDTAGPQPPADTRTPDQKRADIFHAVFVAQARSADVPTMGGAHPTLLVTVTKESLQSRTGVAWVDGEAEPISADAAARIADAGGFQEAELSPGGEILSLGRTQRCFSPAQRRALAARDRGCLIPGCDVPARWCEAHHIDPARNGGLTDVDNAALLCWWHHFIIDDGPYQLRMTDGVPEVRWIFGSHASPWVRAAHTLTRRGRE